MSVPSGTFADMLHVEHVLASVERTAQIEGCVPRGTLWKTELRRWVAQSWNFTFRVLDPT